MLITTKKKDRSYRKMPLKCVIVKLEGEVTKQNCTWKNDKSLSFTVPSQPAGCKHKIHSSMELLQEQVIDN